VLRLFVLLSFILGPFLPGSNILFYVGTYIGERLLYLPSIGFCMLVADALETFRLGDTEETTSATMASLPPTTPTVPTSAPRAPLQKAVGGSTGSGGGGSGSFSKAAAAAEAAAA